MIQYFQNMRRKRGFTLVELIVVIAIIAVLIAIIVPGLNKRGSEINAANMRSRDFYSALQYNMTRYQKTESVIIPQLATEVTFIEFKKEKAANILKNEYTYIEMRVDNGVQYVHVGSSLSTLTAKTSTSCDTEFEKMLMADLANTVEESADGYYFGIVRYDNNTGDFRVVTTHFMEEDLPSTVTADGHLMFVEYGVIKNDIVCGTCSSDKDSTGRYVGDPGTYFLNIDDPALNKIN